VDRATVVGSISGFALILLAIVTQGSLVTFLSASSVVVVVGGVFAASMVNYGLSDFKIGLSTLLFTVKNKGRDFRTDIELINMFARRARRNGMLSLDDDVQKIQDPYLQNGLQIVIDGIAGDDLIQILDDQIRAYQRQVESSVSILESMAGYAPGFGMIGTVIGMILMLQNISDPESLGAGLSIALLTTLYGSILANMIFTPLAGKLSHLGDTEIARKEMFRVGILGMVNAENPRIIEKKMLNFVEPTARIDYLIFHSNNTNGRAWEEKLYSNWTEKQKEKWDELLENQEVVHG